VPSTTLARGSSQWRPGTRFPRECVCRILEQRAAPVKTIPPSLMSRKARAVSVKRHANSIHHRGNAIDCAASIAIQRNSSEDVSASSRCFTVMNAIRVALERHSPIVSADISRPWNCFDRAAARLLKNLDKRIREKNGLPVSHCRPTLWPALCWAPGKCSVISNCLAQDFD